MWTCCILKAAKCDLQSSGGTVDRTRHCSSRGPMKAGGCKLVTVTAGFGSKAASVRSWAISDAELVPETACIPRVWSLQGCLGPHGYNKPCSCKVIEWAQRVNVHAVKNRHMRCRIYRWQLSQMQLDTKMPHIDTPLKMRVRDPHLAGFAHKIKVAVLWDSLSLSLSMNLSYPKSSWDIFQGILTKHVNSREHTNSRPLPLKTTWQTQQEFSKEYLETLSGFPKSTNSSSSMRQGNRAAQSAQIHRQAPSRTRSSLLVSYLSSRSRHPSAHQDLTTALSSTIQTVPRSKPHPGAAIGPLKHTAVSTSTVAEFVRSDPFVKNQICDQFEQVPPW